MPIVLQNKIDMVNSLKEIEIAYNLLKSESKDSKAMDPIDEAYKKLKTNIEVLEKSSDEFDLINRYLKNTHAATHTHYSLELEEVFKVKRQGEEKRFKPFKKLHNRQLLWHGSRLTNFVGILSQLLG
ncbi:Poly [ADP-ribose] polymerase 1 [Armadillidium vulgare]|nr:Poly [ADP-ribose] polymerase 1 [Armadillidium vulgare]